VAARTARRRGSGAKAASSSSRSARLAATTSSTRFWGANAPLYVFQARQGDNAVAEHLLSGGADNVAVPGDASRYERDGGRPVDRDEGDPVDGHQEVHGVTNFPASVT
jgi:hypothetical protein